MKRLFGAFLVLGVAGCGAFTNVPAQFHIASIEPSSVIVNFKEDGAGKVTAEYTVPVMTLRGQPGSIGATITEIDVEYLGSGLKALEGLPSVALNTHVRVETSALRENYNQGVIQDPTYKDRPLIVGTGKITLPIVTRNVLDFGGSAQRVGKDNAITARIVLSGQDDANWRVQMEAFVPVVFTGATK